MTFSGWSPNHYSLFHQFARSLFNFFSRIIFSSSPTIPENVVKCFCVLSKLDHSACSNFPKLQLFFHHYRETRILLHAKWSNLQNTPKNSINFKPMLGEDGKMTKKIAHE